MASNAKVPAPTPTTSNHVITGPPKGVVGGNRKKAKRRAKQNAKAATHTHPHTHGLPPAGGQQGDVDIDYDEDPLGYGDEDDDDYSDPNDYSDYYPPRHNGPNGYSMPPPPSSGVGKNKKKKGNAHHMHSAYNPELLGNDMPTPQIPISPRVPRHSHSHTTAMQHIGGKSIWNTSTQQERQNIKDFWLSLSEDERKSLLKIEKEAVMRKMKQQQKHSCSCTVCGRKRTAIEEELEVLYEGYYEELEHYAHHDHPALPSTDGLIPDPLQHRPPHPLAIPPPPLRTHPNHRRSQFHEHDEDDDYSSQEGEEEYDDDEDEEGLSEDDEDDEEPEQVIRNNVPDLFNFGSSLTVKGILTPWLEKLQSGLKMGNADNLLTVADDLLKNDGRKFIEMMEQLAERRMARENQAEYDAQSHAHYQNLDPTYHDEQLAADEFEEEETASYDSQDPDDYDEGEDEDEINTLTEEQRVQEGKRMFQIFAARMFEQRVLTAYKEKVARERQQKLLEELEDETKLEAQREAKKQRDAEKKKAKKKQQQAAKAEEKAKKDAEKAAEEARLREIEEKKLEEQRLKKEEQRRKKEEARRKQAEEAAKKEAEKLRRQQEEQQRREEAERKAREQRAAEKAKKEELKKREREEREAREKTARELKAQEEKKEREAKAKAEREAKEREKAAQQAAQPPSQPLQPPQITKRPSQIGMVAVPPVLQKQASSGISSPHPSIAIPAIPKAPTPAKPRQTSQQGSHASSPKQTQSQISSVPSKSSSPSSTAPQPPQQQAPPTQPKTIMQKAGNQQPPPHQPHMISAASPQPLQPPPGMPHPQHTQGFPGMQPLGFNHFPGPQQPMMNMGPPRGPMPMYPGPPMNNRFGLPQSPPGMMPPGQGRFPFDPPPGFAPPNHAAPIGQPPIDSARTHSRQPSSDAVNQPIARPAPIQRPSSVKPQNLGGDVDDLSRHLGSSALLDDSDEPLTENRRIPNRSSQPQLMPPLGSSFGAPSAALGWNAPPFGQSPQWGASSSSLPLQNPGMSSWANNNAAFAANGAFNGPARPLGGMQLNRPLTVRLAICNACKQLSSTNAGDHDDFHHIDTLLRQIPPTTLDPLPSLREIEEICETEGDSQNGGGELRIRPETDLFSVKWVADAITTPEMGGRGVLGGLGEIGSPMPAKAVASPGFGAPGMGRAPGSFGQRGF